MVVMERLGGAGWVRILDGAPVSVLISALT